MKKLVFLTLATTLALSTVVLADTETPVVTSSTVTTTSNGTATAVNPIAVIDRDTMEILDPARTSAEALGYDVSWIAETKTVIFTKGEDVFEATIGDRNYVYNGEVFLEASAPKIAKDTAYVSPRFINAITPYDNSPQIQDPTGSENSNIDPNYDVDVDIDPNYDVDVNIDPNYDVDVIDNGQQIEDKIAAAGLSPQAEEVLFSTVNEDMNTFKISNETILAEYRDAYLETGGSLEDYVQPSTEVGYNIVGISDNYVSFQVYSFVAVGSSNQTDKYYTIDKETGDFLTLEDVYGDDYNTFVKNSIKSQISVQQAQDPEEYSFYFQDSIDDLVIDEDTNFYINDNSQLVVVLPKYAIAPGVYGALEFTITNYTALN
ncbi:MAG: stalk domain-containing protein [Lachnospirales bacterium]